MNHTPQSSQMPALASKPAPGHRAPALAGLLSLLLLTLLVATPAQADTKIRTSSFEYTAQGLLSKEVIEPTSPNDCLQTSHGYDTFGNRTTLSTSACTGASAPATNSASTPRTASSSFGADGRFPVTSTNALGQSETKVFDARFGTLKSLTGPNGLTTRWDYDGFGRKTLELRADATRTTWVYKLCTEVGANCPATVGPSTITWVAIEQSLAVNLAANAPEQRQYYDTLNRVVRTQTQGFDATAGAAPTLVQDTEYNALGQVKRQSNQYALSGGTAVWSNYTYDPLGRIQTESHPDTNATTTGNTATTTFAYNALSTTVTNAKGQAKTTVKNAQGQIASVTDALGSTVTYRYDALGNLTQTNAAGSITTLHYNQRGQKTAMQDPAMGSWTYSYNAYGELVSQRDSLNQSTTLEYDVLGRMTKRTEPDLTSEWSFDKKFDTSACGKGIGKLCEAKANNGYNRKHSYDALGRTSSTATVLDNAGAPAVVSETFDPNTGRVASKTWPTGYQARYAYSALGYLTTVTGGGTNGFSQTVSHTVLAMNAQGQITQYKTGNNVTTVKTYAPDTQRLTGQSATSAGQASGNVLKQGYTYDALGNLLSRTDNAPGVNTQEGFSYDSLNRLSTATLLGGAVSPPTTTQVMYDARGNIAYKSDVGRYWYDAARPNRMTAVTLETAPGATHALTGTRTLSYAFDDLKTGAQTVNTTQVGNGNLEYTVSHDAANARHTVRYESYTSFNMPKDIILGNFITNTTSTQDRTLSFVYGPEHQRIKQNVTLTGNGTSAYFAGNTWYLNGEDSLGLSYEKEVRANGTTEHKHYLSAAGVTFALVTSRTGTLNGLSATTTSYFHHDQLGSISAISNEAGAVTERLAYDPWGKRRFITSTPGKTDALDAIVGQKTDRGYTEHEHLDEMGIIHMNGRIFDPLMGRFMSSDPIIEAPTELASYNRYSYVWNNPLNRTDPSGFCWICDRVNAVANDVNHAVNAYMDYGNHIGDVIRTDPTANAAVTIAVAYFGGPNAAAIFTGLSTADRTGSPEEGLKAGLISLGTSWAMGQVGDVAPSGVGNVAGHAAVGCVSSVAGGGSCGSGAASAAVGSMWSQSEVKFDSVAANLVAHAVVGGTASLAAGGSFANGAKTAAFGYLFNHLGDHSSNEKSKNNSSDVDFSKDLNVSHDAMPDRGIERSDTAASVVNDSIQIAGSTGSPANNQAQNAQFKAVVRILNLTPAQRQQLHREVSGQNYGYHEILQIGGYIKNGQ